ncbi:MAG: organic solvent tolerance protein OstA [Planctomycetaceae bacterium]|nr:organic solvent tolerance protein OstA [Planctomycetaceae bacterium]
MLTGAIVACTSIAVGEVQLPEADPGAPIRIEATQAGRWTEGSYEVFQFDRGCRITQGNYHARASQAVLWIHRAGKESEDPNLVLVYLEGDVDNEVQIVPDTTRPQVQQTQTDCSLRLPTYQAVDVRVENVAEVAGSDSPLFHRAVARRNRPAEYVVRGQLGGDASRTRQILFFSRGNVNSQAQWTFDPATNQSVGIIDSGVNMIVRGLSEADLEGVELHGYDLGDAIDVSADRLVIWTVNLFEMNERGESLQADNVPLEIYLEGNVVFRQGESVIHADRMYYDVTRKRGIVLDAELLTPVPGYEGWLRLRTQILQQLDKNRFFAEDAFLTSSRMGRPGYRIQVDNVTLDKTAEPMIDPVTGLPRFDEAGRPVVDHEYFTTSRNNFLFIREVPIFYWPVLATNLEEPTFYLKRVRVKNDSIFGTQVLTDWDMFQILGWRNRPEGTSWEASLDYLSERGWGHGTNATYARGNFFGIPGPTAGQVDYWGIEDDGLDNLGLGRRSLDPEKDYRHRLFWQHRQRLPGDFQVTAEAGWISDRNFLEQYFEREWDELKDETTGIELKRLTDNRAWSITADARINSHVTQTEWLPRFDHFWLGQELLGDRLTWYEHTSAGYARFRTTTQPEDPADLALFRWLPWESTSPTDPLSVESERFATRHEVDLPFQLGPFKIVPYGLGEFAHWGADVNGDDLQRLYGQAGVRASLPVWRVDPGVQNHLFNVNGLAHKVVFDAEFAVAESDQNLGLLPLYDPLDDNSIEAFRRRYTVTTFGGAVPAQFDERSYALRSGLASWVTSPSTEIADDLMFVRLGMRHRWQTKRGAPGNERTVDWVTFDTHATVFPRPDDDNFGEMIGLVDYDLKWHVGDRVSVLSSGYFDFFDQGGRMISLGGYLNRPPRGGIYAGIHYMDGPFSSTVLSYSHTYRMSDKWIMAFGSSYDISDNRNIGQTLSFTRVGESFLVSAGFNIDTSRDSIGVQFAVEPRFLPKSRLGQVAGAQIPVAGAGGLE